jgi:hypothetical protein
VLRVAWKARLDRLNLEIASVKAELAGSDCSLSLTHSTPHGVPTIEDKARIGSEVPLHTHTHARTHACTHTQRKKVLKEAMCQILASECQFAVSQISVHASIHAKSSPSRRASQRAQLQHHGNQYAVQCWAARSAFADPSCNCLSEPAHPKLGLRRTIRIVVGSWHASHLGSWICLMPHVPPEWLAT